MQQQLQLGYDVPLVEAGLQTNEPPQFLLASEDAVDEAHVEVHE